MVPTHFATNVECRNWRLGDCNTAPLQSLESRRADAVVTRRPRGSSGCERDRSRRPGHEVIHNYGGIGAWNRALQVIVVTVASAIVAVAHTDNS